MVSFCRFPAPDNRSVPDRKCLTSGGPGGRVGAMADRRNMDIPGATALVGFALLLAFNQVVIKVVNEGLQPVFFAAIRSAGGALCMYLWIRANRRRIEVPPGTVFWGIMIGIVFSLEFIGLFVALDLTTVTRTSVIFYSMPLWLALIGHFVLPGEQMHRAKALGLVLAFSGVAWAIIDRGAGTAGQASI